MGYFDKYKPYLLGTLVDIDEKQIKNNVFSELTNKCNEKGIESPNVYLSSFSSMEAGFIVN